MSGRGKMKIRAERKNNSRAAEKWVTGLQTFRRVVQCQQDVFRVKKKSSVCDILSEKSLGSSQSI